MKKQLLSLVWISLACMAAPAMAGNDRYGEASHEYARVIESRPVYRQVSVSQPREQCWNERVRTAANGRGNGSDTPALVSAVVGGAIGNAVGTNKSSRRVGAVVGAVLGHSVGRDIVSANSRSDRPRYRTVRHCETVDEYVHEERLVGYDVRYRYEGREYSVRTDRDPGERIRVRVHVEPVL
ncbi:MAG: glycine zipper 2TM domain-containing protein [Pseudohongiellaceae bacterium]